MSRVTALDHVNQPTDSGKSVPTFNRSIKSMKEMTAKRRLGLFPAESSLTCVQQNYLFGRLKEHIKDVLASNTEIQREFTYQLMMSTPNANAFFNILVGWRSGANKAHESVLDKCIRDFQMLYPEVYELINHQAPIYKPS